MRLFLNSNWWSRNHACLMLSAFQSSRATHSRSCGSRSRRRASPVTPPVTYPEFFLQFLWVYSFKCCNMNISVPALPGSSCDNLFWGHFIFKFLRCGGMMASTYQYFCASYFVSKSVSKYIHLCLHNKPYSLNCHGGAKLVFHMLCRIKLFSNVHRTEIVLVMGRELTMGVSSTKLDRQQQNFAGHILLSWSVVLQGRPARQNGGDHDWLIQQRR